MLRNQLGDDLYRRCIKTYLQRHRFANAVTSDLSAVIEELSGRSFDQFFDQWVYHAAQPELGVEYSWDEKTKLARLAITQNQKLSADVLVFNFLMTSRFKSRSGAVDRQIIVKEKAEDFYFPLAEAPEVVRLDPRLTVLARITFNPPTAMLRAQLAESGDMPGRLIAAEQLGAKKEKDLVNLLKETLNHDSFYAGRLAGPQSLRAFQPNEAFEALPPSTQPIDSRI